MKTERKIFFKNDKPLRDHFGSNNAVIVFNGFMHRFNQKREGFWKHTEPCSKKHSYRRGDSWVEELGISRRTFNSIKKQFVTSYPSKSAYLAAEDKFKGKIFLSYYCRPTHQIFYLINWQAYDALISKIYPLKHSRTPSRGSVPISVQTNTIPTVQKGVVDAQNTNTNTHNNTTQHTEVELGFKVLKDLVDIFNSITKKNVWWRDGYAQNLYKLFYETLKGSLEEFRKFCRGIASNDFLMARAKNTNFPAPFGWLIKPETVQNILDGFYGVMDYLSFKTAEEKENSQKITDICREVSITEQKLSSCKAEFKQKQKKEVQPYVQTIDENVKKEFREEYLKELRKKYPSFEEWTPKMKEDAIENVVQERLTDYAIKNLGLPSVSPEIQSLMDHLERSLNEKQKLINNQQKGIIECGLNTINLTLNAF